MVFKYLWTSEVQEVGRNHVFEIGYHPGYLEGQHGLFQMLRYSL